MEEKKEKDNRWMFTFSVNQKVKMEVDELVEGKDGETVVKVEKEVNKPVRFAIKKPTRQLRDDGDLYYAQQMSYFVQKKLLTRAQLQKRFANDGGTMSDPEKVAYTENTTKLLKAEDELKRAQLNLEQLSEEAKETKIEQCLKDIGSFRAELQDLTLNHTSLFEFTAENKAEQKTAYWWILYLSYQEGEDGYTSVFGDGTEEERLVKADELDQSEDLFWNEVLQKLAFYVGIWFSGQAQTEEEFKEIAENFSQTAES